MCVIIIILVKPFIHKYTEWYILIFDVEHLPYRSVGVKGLKEVDKVMEK